MTALSDKARIGYLKAKRPATNGGRASSRAERAAESPQIGRSVSPKPPLESPQPQGLTQTASPPSAISEKPPYQKAESPTGNSVGCSPTLRGTPIVKPCKGAIKWMPPLQGLKLFEARYVGLRPTLLTTPFQGDTSIYSKVEYMLLTFHVCKFCTYSENSVCANLKHTAPCLDKTLFFLVTFL